jgi:hypothetical protein
MGTPGLSQPVPPSEQVRGHGPNGADLLGRLATRTGGIKQATTVLARTSKPQHRS